MGERQLVLQVCSLEGNQGRDLCARLDLLCYLGTVACSYCKLHAVLLLGFYMMNSFFYHFFRTDSVIFFADKNT